MHKYSEASKDFVQVRIDDELHWRRIDHVEMEPGYIRSGRSNPYYIKRLIPVTHEDEELVWVVGSDIPLIIRPKC